MVTLYKYVFKCLSIWIIHNVLTLDNPSIIVRCELYYQNDLCMIFNIHVIPSRKGFNGFYRKGVSMYKTKTYITLHDKCLVYGVQAFNTYTKDMYPILRVAE